MSPDSARKTKNALEWTVFGLSSIMVAGTIGWLVVAAMHTDSGPARLHVETGEPETIGGRLEFPVRVTNAGGQVAENVEVRVTLGAGSDRQDATFNIDYIPREATREGAVSFDATGAAAEKPQSIVVGYSTP